MLIYHRDFKPHGVLYYGTGQNIQPFLFDTETQRPTRDKRLLKTLGKEEQRDLLLLEDRLNVIQSVSRKISEKLLFAKLPFQSVQFRDMLQDELGNGEYEKKSRAQRDPIEKAERIKKLSTNSISINQYIDTYIEDIESGKRLTDQGQKLKAGSLKNYLTFKSQFKLYQAQIKSQINFGDIDLEFYQGFIVFLNKKKYSPNTIGKHIARLKKIMRSAKEDGIYKGNEHEKKYFKTLEVDTEHVYLTMSEIEAMRQLDLSETKDLEVFRDVFLIGCAIAQRISDYKGVRPEHITKTSKGVKILKLHQRKTGEEVMIPIGAELDLLLSKYQYQPPTVSEQKLNEALKKIAKKAEINTPVEIEMVRGGVKTRQVFPKYDLIKSHTARRTGATNMYLAGIPTIDIMKITGHKKESNFMKYICITKEETADKLSFHPYFK